jgi:Rab family protein
MYYRSADVALLVYDVTQLESFEALEQWAAELSEKAPPNLQIIIVGNKIDLVDDRVVQVASADAWAKLHGARCYLEVSAKTGVGIVELFEKATELVTSSRTASAVSRNDKTSLVARKEENTKEGCC